MQKVGNGFLEDYFDLESYKKKTIMQKREIFWKRNSGRFTVISTAAMLGMFGVAYFAYAVLADLLTYYTLMR